MIRSLAKKLCPSFIWDLLRCLKIRYNIWKSRRADYGRACWYYGDTEKVLKVFKRRSRQICNSGDTNASFWAHYISVLFLHDHMDDAEKIYHRHEEELCDERLPIKCPGFACFLRHLGLDNGRMMQTYDTYMAIMSNHRNRSLEKFVEGKTVAIVGNGPSELGKSLGAEIDGHDVVIRFNDYDLNGHERDYGTRTDVWSKRLSEDEFDHTFRSEEIKVVVYEPDLSRCGMLADGYLQAMISENKKCIVEYMDVKGKVVFTEKNRIYPTSGASMIERLRQSGAKFVDVYGFAFLEEGGVKELGHFYGKNNLGDEASLKRVNHNILTESEILRLYIKGRRIIMEK